jgi:adenylate kinase
MSRRYHPNIIVTGTPGCGKTSHCQSLLSQLNENLGEQKYNHYSISDVAKERKCIDSYDERLDTSVVDEDKLLDSLEPDLENGGALVDWHCCEIFPERLIDLVVVLHTDNSILYDRLTKRGYKDVKIQENIDCEIMDVIGQEARDSYIPEIVIELNSNTVEEMEENVERIAAWATNWVSDHQDGVTNELDPEVAAAAAAAEADDDDEN